jgi:dUTP pyrophosphatase
MSKAAEFGLWHCRTGHACDETTCELHKHLEDYPKVKKHAFWKCPSCMQEKARARSFPSSAGIDRVNKPATSSIGQPTQICKPQEATDGTTLPDPATNEDDDLQPGQMFHMDFGFMRGSTFSDKDEDGRIITSLDGMNSYLIIIDRKTRRTWVFLTKSKIPPLKTVTDFLSMNGSRTATRRIVRSDQGGELYKSTAFQEAIRDSKFLLEPTGAGAPQQNGMAERPNQTLGNMTRCLLRTANLPPEYWSWALTHAVYLKNRLPHQATGCTPYLAWTGRKPSAKLLRIFGCPVVVKNPGKRPAKLDHHTSSGVFLGYTATDNNIYYRDNKSKRVKIATHVQFDEVSMTIPRSTVSPAIAALQELGVPKDIDTTSAGHLELIEADTTDEMKVQLLSDNAHLPQRATDNSAGYDICSAVQIVIPPGEYRLIPTDITFEPPKGTYGQLLSRSGLSANHGIDVRAGTIDADYRGNVMVKLENSSATPFQVNVGDRIAQLVLYYISQSTIKQVEELSRTQRNDSGIGSTGITHMTQRSMTDTPPTTAPINVLDDDTGQPPPDTAADICQEITKQDGIKPYDMWLSSDPFDKRLNVAIDIRGDHNTLELITQMCQYRHRVQLVNI